MIRNILCAGILLALAILGISCGGGSSPYVPPSEWVSPVHHWTAEVFPSDYVVEKEYQFVLMKSVGDAVNAKPNEFVVGLYTADGALYPYGASLRMVSVGDLLVNELGIFTAHNPGQKTLKVKIIDAEDHVLTTVQFGPYFHEGVLWDSPVRRFHIEAEPVEYVVGQYYDMELIHNMGDLVYRKQDQVMVGLYRKDDNGAIFSEVLGLKFVPSGTSLFINEVGEFTASSVGKKTIIAEVVDSVGHLYITVVFHPTFVSGSPPPPPDCRDLHPTREAIDGFWWDCIGGVWSNTGEPVNPPPPDKNLYALDGNLDGFYSGSGQQSLTLELKPIPSGVGFVNWEILSGPSGAMTVPLGSHPQRQCEFYYCAAGAYSIRAVPYESETAFDTGKPPVGQPALFTVSISHE